MKIALVHDYLREAGGAEKVLEILTEMYPEAPIYTAFVKNGTAVEKFKNKTIIESKWGWLLKIGRFYSYFRFLLPFVWRSVDLSSYDLVITSCSGYLARGFKKGSKTKVIAYCHTPPKWLYGYATPTQANNKWWGKVYMWFTGPIVRNFDFMSAQEVDVWIANSREVAKRIRKFYRKEAKVIYPPVGPIGSGINATIPRGDYYLLAARIVGAKGLLEATQAAKKYQFRLIIAGEEVETQLANQLKLIGSPVEMVGRVTDQKLIELYRAAKGFIALAPDEDFGITAVEAMLFGTPVLALNRGGYRETVIPGETGILIDDNDEDSIYRGILEMEKHKWDSAKLTKWAAKFSRDSFRQAMREVVNA